MNKIEQPNSLTLDDLSLDERETHISQMASDRHVWTVYTDDKVMIERLNKLAQANPDDAITRNPHGVGFTYTFPATYVKIKAPRKLSDEHKAKLAAQLARGRVTQGKKKT